MIKGLSVKQPWASWIINGRDKRAHIGNLAVTAYKTIETRKWFTNYRGPIVICAGKNPDDQAMPILIDKVQRAIQYPFGVALGVVQMLDCRKMVPADGEAAMYKLPNGIELYSWVLSDPRPFQKPIPLIGQLGLFDLEWDILEAAKRALSSPAVAR